MREIEENVPLGPLTTLEVGGPARYFVEAETEVAVESAFDFARGEGVPVFVLGGGSNVVVSDRGFDGLVVKIGLTGVRDNAGLITAAAGENWDALVKYCVDRELAGSECLSGIPGTVGGTPVQNVGAYGQEVSETIRSVRCYDRETGKIIELPAKECGFGYRVSIFNSTARDRYVVLAVNFEMSPGGAPKIAYKDVAEHFRGKEPTLAETRNAILSIRREKSMVIDPGDPNRRSVGSFFKNPVVGRETLERIAALASPEVPNFPVGGSSVKIPAAWLIEQAGFGKGYSLGKVGISSRHTLAFINLGGAAAADIVALKDLIQSAVFEKFDIQLVPEPVFVGEFAAKF